MKTSMIFLFLTVGIIIIIGGFFFFSSQSSLEEPVEQEIIQNESEDVSSENHEPESETETTQENSEPQTHHIEISNFDFNPNELKIKSGDTVVWTNKDFDGHTVTSDSGNELDSPLIRRNEEFSHTFNKKGTFEYHCTPHPYMKAKIIVE